MTTVDTSQVGALRLGKGRFDLLIRKRRVHLLRSMVLDGKGATGTVDESSPYSWFVCVVRLSLCGIQFSLVVDS